MLDTFEVAKLTTSILHYIFFISAFIFACYYKSKSISHFFYKFYVLISIWAVVCFITNGCPLTHLENRYALYRFGVPFYPEYTFTKSNIYSIITWGPLYLPLFVVLFINLTEHFTKNDTNI